MTVRGPNQSQPLAVVRARDTADVSAALAWAHEHRVPVSVRGAGTGLAGGANAYPGGLVISLADMTEVLQLDAANRTATVQAGVITAELDTLARESGLFFRLIPRAHAPARSAATSRPTRAGCAAWRTA